jgi:hypothetical protein
VTAGFIHRPCGPVRPAPDKNTITGSPYGFQTPLSHVPPTAGLDSDAPENRSLSVRYCGYRSQGEGRLPPHPDDPPQG